MTTVTQLEALMGMRAAKEAVLRVASGAHRASPQSLLFYGADATGQFELAQILARAWLCGNPGESGACGKCQSCRTFLNGHHVDLLLVEPKPPSHLIRLGAIFSDSQSNEISVQEFLRSFPVMGSRKVVIVREADRMNLDAANAFLKTLEEPPSYALIILTAAAPSSLLATIVSRCLAVACEAPSDAEIQKAFPEWSDLSYFLEGSEHRAKELTPFREVYSALDTLAHDIPSLPPREAIRLSDRFRELCDKVDSIGGNGARASQLQVLGGLALALSRIAPSYALPVVEAHRRIQGNGNATIVLDALAAELTLA